MQNISQISQEALGNDYYAIHLTGEIDVNYLPQLENTLKPITEMTQLKGIILDCKKLVFIDSKIVGFIVYLYTRLSRSNQKLVIAETNETINDIMTLVGLTTIIKFTPTLDEAVKQLNIYATQ
jgi:anti-anti-sigma factor